MLVKHVILQVKSCVFDCPCGKKCSLCKKKFVGNNYVSSTRPNNGSNSGSKYLDTKWFSDNDSVSEMNCVSSILIHTPNYRPVVLTTLNDTGSPVNLISLTAFNKLRVKPKMFKVDQVFSSCADDELPVTGYVYLKVRIPESKQWVRLKVYVCEVLSYDFILGNDGLNKFGISLCFKTTFKPPSCLKHQRLTFYRANGDKVVPVHKVFVFNKEKCTCGLNHTVCTVDSFAFPKEDNDVFLEVVSEATTVPDEHLNDRENLNDVDERVKGLLHDYKGIWPSTLPPQHAKVEKFTVELEEGAKPFQCKPHRLSYSHKRALESEITKLLSLGFIFPYNGDYVSPCVVVPKKGGELRLCIDYRRLNAISKSKKYPLPVLEDFLAKASGKCVFSSLDLRSGYWQIPVDRESQKLLAFTTHVGNYTWRVKPFGLKSATENFQHIMDSVLHTVVSSQCAT